jgi:transposase
VETAALWKGVEKPNRCFPTPFHRAWETLPKKQGEFPTHYKRAPLEVVKLLGITARAIALQKKKSIQRKESPMNDKYIGLDVHQSTIVMGVTDEKGKQLMQSIVETKASTIREAINGLSGTLHVTFEEGTHAHWLYDVLRPQVASLVVCDPRRNKLLQSGNKADKVDAWKLANLLRAGLTPVYHGEQGTRTLKELVHSYEGLVQDSTRVMNRLKALFRSRAIPCTGRKIYQVAQRKQWLDLLTDPGARMRAEHLYQQLEYLQPLRQTAKRLMLAESRKHSASKVLRQIPSLGPIRVAQILATVTTPHRFRTKRQFWAYIGLGVRTESSAQYQIIQGQVRKSGKLASTRGLNQNYNRTLKYVFKSAATRARATGPFKRSYESSLSKGIRPTMALLTLARKIAAVTLVLWKKGERFDSKKLTSQTT